MASVRSNTANSDAADILCRQIIGVIIVSERMELFHHGHFWSNFAHVQGPRVHLAFEHRFLTPNVKITKLPFWIILYLFSGNPEVEIPSEQKTIAIAPSHVYLFRPDLRLIDHIPVNTPIHSSYLCFANGEQTRLPEMISPGNWAMFYDTDGQVGSLLRQIATIGQQHGDTEFWQAQGLFCQILSKLHNSQNVDGNRWIIPGSDSSLQEYVKLSSRVYEFMHSNINRMITLNDIAEAMGISVSTLSHCYLKETGTTPMKAYAHMKVERIKELLKLGVPLKTIAQQMSFADSSGLSNFFKRNVGISPREYMA